MQQFIKASSLGYATFKKETEVFIYLFIYFVAGESYLFILEQP